MADLAALRMGARGAEGGPGEGKTGEGAATVEGAAAASAAAVTLAGDCWRQCTVVSEELARVGSSCAQLRGRVEGCESELREMWRQRNAHQQVGSLQASVALPASAFQPPQVFPMTPSAEFIGGASKS